MAVAVRQLFLPFTFVFALLPFSPVGWRIAAAPVSMAAVTEKVHAKAAKHHENHERPNPIHTNSSVGTEPLSACGTPRSLSGFGWTGRPLYTVIFAMPSGAGLIHQCSVAPDSIANADRIGYLSDKNHAVALAA